MTPWQHYVIDGRRKGYDNGNNPPEDAFFREGYEVEYPDVRNSCEDAWHHYAETGLKEGRDNGLHPGNEQFFAEGYLEMYPDVVEGRLDPWHHYVLQGIAEGRDNGCHPGNELFFADGYLRMYPDVAESGMDPWRHYVLFGKKEGRDNGFHPTDTLFFADGYSAMYSDVAASGADPWHHYLEYGEKEGRDNGWHPDDAEFFAAGYLEMYPEVASSGLNPWWHYLKYGKKEGRDNGHTSPEKVFFAKGYLEMYPDVAKSGEDPWHHYVMTGKKEGRDNGWHPDDAKFFSSGYLEMYPEVARSGLNPWWHYLKYGKKEGRDNGHTPPESIFFAKGYLEMYPDVAKSGEDPWHHYVMTGKKEGRDNGWHPDDAKFFSLGYLEMYPEVAISGLNPWWHYLTYGKHERRDSGHNPPENLFFAKGYLEMYPEVAKSGEDPWHHYVLTGKREGRDNGWHPDEALFFREGYEAEYSDVKSSGENGWHHYAEKGRAAGRDNGNHPSRSVFDQDVYLALNPEIRKVNTDPWIHYAKYGINEHRRITAAPFFDADWYLRQYPQVIDDPDVKNGVMTPEAHYFYKGWKLGYDPSLNFDTKHYLERYRDVRERKICPLYHYLSAGWYQNRQPYNPHSLTEPTTIVKLPEPYESGLKPKECKSVRLDELQDNALLIMLAEFLGDVVANEPIARYLKWKYQDRPIYWVVESRYRDIVRFNPFLSGYLEVNSLKECIEITRALSGNQKIVNMFFDGRPDKVANPKYFWHARNNGIGFGNFFANDCLLSSMSQAAGLDRLLLAPRFWENPAYSCLTQYDIWGKIGAGKSVKNLKNKKGKSLFILLHTKSNDSKRDWKGEKFSELTERILRNYPNAIVAELGMSPVVESSSERFIPLKKLNDLQLIYQIIKNADLFIGVDSAFMHMANISGVRAVSIMGSLGQFSYHCPYSGRFWNGDGITFVRAEEFEESPSVEVDKVFEAVTKLLG